MQALRWHGRGDLRLEEIAEPGEPPAGHAVVEVAFCGICGTDLHEITHGPNMIRTGKHPLSGQAPPVTMGHEMSGRVVALGGERAGVEIGTRVAVDPCLTCDACRWCLHGDYHICAKGGSVGLASDGGFARYATVPLRGLHPVPDAVSDEMAALAEPLAVGLHAAGRAGVGPGDTVLVLGAGPIGIAAILGARMSGAGAVYVSEPVTARHAAAVAAGATEVFDPTTADVRRTVFLRTGRIGPDVAIDATGRPDAVDLGLRSLRRGGRMAVAGITEAALSVDVRQLVLYERSLCGSLGYNFDIPRVLALMADGRLDASCLLTGVRPLSEGLTVVDELTGRTHDHLKVLLTPTKA
ncbi:alcohol dehydrogenase catalytic domain-containing protein [Streptomyces mutabilis]|uniref:alcohol dehydrogenase catalytic domain-containing protein n=1 Tax=Streptomyces mutabilis TaxID=67332 RepID=UPI0033BCD256